MNIAYITTWGRRCGLSTHAEHLAEHLVIAGHEVNVLDEIQNKEPVRSNAPQNVAVVSAWRDTNLANDCLSHIVRLHADVCLFAHAHVHLSPAIIGSLANGCHQQGCALVVAWHNLVGTRCDAQELPQIDGHIVFNPGGVDHLVSVGVPREKILYLPHACPTVGSRKSTCQDRVATFGLMYPSKGLEQTITAVDVARKASGRDITLDIYSSYNAVTEAEYREYMSEIDRLIAHKRMQDCVNVWCGFPSDAGLIRALSAADVLMFCYHAEVNRLSGSAALSFAIGAGRPIIVSDIPHFAGDDAQNACRLIARDAHDAGEKLADVLAGLDAGYDLGANARGYAAAWGYADHAAVCAAFLSGVLETVKATPLYHPPAKVTADPVCYVVTETDTKSRVGVVIATKDRPEKLRTAIESCGEVAGIAVDDGSSRAACVHKATKRTGFGLLRSDVSHGASWARNRGVAALDCEWVQFLDDDDVLMADWRERISPFLDDHDIIIGGAFVPDRGALVVATDVMTSQIAVRRSAFLEAGGFREDCRWAEELDLIGRMETRMARVKRLSVPTCVRPVRGGSGVPPKPARPAGPIDFSTKGF